MPWGSFRLFVAVSSRTSQSSALPALPMVETDN